LELVDESDEFVDEDLTFRLVEFLHVLMHASETHHTQPVVTAEFLEKSIDMLLLVLGTISLDVPQLFLLTLEFAVCAEIEVLV
jgi:hypothetical protein